MTEHRPDAEELAALADGRLGESERADVLARLAASEVDLEAYSEAVAVLGELHPVADERGISPLRRAPTPWWRNPGVAGLAAAAGLAALVALPWALDREAGVDPTPGSFVTLVRANAPAAIAERSASGWPARRSGRGPADHARTLRLGAELVWLELGVLAADAQTIGRSAAEIDTLLDGVPAGAPLAAVFRSIADHPDRPPSDLRPLIEQAEVSLGRLVDDELLTLGAWVEAARIAAQRRQAAFFTAPATRELLDSAVAGEALGEQGRDALDEIGATLQRDGELDWDSLRRQLDALPLALATGVDPRAAEGADRRRPD